MLASLNKYYLGKRFHRTSSSTLASEKKWPTMQAVENSRKEFLQITFGADGNTDDIIDILFL